ncbi:DUF4959 domain-containing protein [Sphingobacterium olei]|uniref:DUF4959 domain-containing protein n=1 Tax=Sphingobacterium olei TaxID=2571155 RepID=A0A4V5MNB6_9SPHI|nr:DUF4959 domain-containing protein [Sphingobacterium olei]TJZ63218.1 DUF4959 domain-containing protein [Sphingobacterium olei]
MIKRIKKTDWLTYVMPLVFVIALLSVSCSKSESPVEVVSDDMSKPDVVTDIKVENLNGSARITYKLPQSKNLLYVLAQYPINDNRIRESKTSYYRDTIIVDGFAEEGEYEVTLYAVSRANVKSDPVMVKVQPQKPNYILVNEGLEIAADFGGASFIGANPTGAPISIHLLAFNPAKNKFEERDPIYVSGNTVAVSLRGFEPTEQEFGVYTSDRFGNTSEIRYSKVVPLFETLLDKSKFFVYRLPSDAPIGFGWELRYFFDGSLNGNGWHTTTAPLTVGTFGIGQTAKISRFVLWNRLPNMFSDQNAKGITIWGSNVDEPQDAPLPRSSEPGTIAGDWVNMGNFTYPNPPSGLPGNRANAADNAWANEGVNFVIPSAAPPVKYIRFVATQTWGGLNYINAMEISFYGSPE